MLMLISYNVGMNIKYVKKCFECTGKENTYLDGNACVVTYQYKSFAQIHH